MSNTEEVDLIWAVIATLVSGALILRIAVSNRHSRNALQLMSQTVDDLNERLQRYSSITSIEDEVARLNTKLEADRVAKTQELQALAERISSGHTVVTETQAQIASLNKELEKVNEAMELQSFGYYQTRYDLKTPEAYKNRLDHVRTLQKQMLLDKQAAVCEIEWRVNGSSREGAKQTKQLLRLMLRAFNGECEAAIAKVTYSNVNVMEERIQKSCEAINKLATVQQASIAPQYVSLRLQELFLVHEYREKLQQAKEEQREIRARMREDELARREIEKALETAARDEERYSEALEKARSEVEAAVGARQEKLLIHIDNLERKLAEALALRAKALSRAQITRSGHVYVISNLGSFGENVYKIGMTRRLDPYDRVLELGDASVPFRFDVHAIIYCDDAPALEHKLHQKFNDRRMNRVNHRKEFFQVSLDEIATAVKEFHGDIEFTAMAEAEEFRKTLSYIDAGKIAPFQEPTLEEFAMDVALEQ